MPIDLRLAQNLLSEMIEDMSRTKKSRKSPANGPVRLSQDKLKEMRALKEQRVKKTKGAKPGFGIPRAIK